MADAAADTINQHISQIEATITSTLNEINSIHDAGSMFEQQTNYMKSHNSTDPTAFTHDLFFPGNVGGTMNSVMPVGVQLYQSTLKKLTDDQAKLDDLQNNQLPAAQKQLADLLNTESLSPENQQAIATTNANAAAEIANTNYMQTTTKYYIIAGVIVIMLIVGAVIFFKYRKGKKAKLAVAA